MENIKFYHISNNKKGFGFTIATKIFKNLEENNKEPFRVLYSVAYCSPVETNFSRALGRMISKSRLESTKLMDFF